MIKRILFTAIAVLVAGGAMMIYGTYKAADDFVKTNEPQLRQYAQMDEAAQNQYISEHADEILAQAQASTSATPDEKADINLMAQIKNDPAVRKAVEDLGRAIMAAAILHSEPIVNDMNEQLKAKFRQEKEHLTDRLEKYADALQHAEDKLKSAQ